MGRKKIYENDFLYNSLRPFTDWALRYSYRKIEITGEEKLPDNGALLITPNHCNTLMDAMVMLYSDKKQTVFGARADLFRKPLIAKIMFFLRILPMVRQRDGLRNVLKNHETQDTIIETLEHRVKFCMYPEGKHRAKHSLQQFGKGAFRVAVAFHEKNQDKLPLYLIPVGIEYSDYFRYRGTCLINFGEPIDVSSFIEGCETDNEAQIIDTLRNELSDRIKGLITYIDYDDAYEAKWALTKMLYISENKGYGNYGGSLYESMLKNRCIVEEIESKVQTSPEKMEELFNDVETFEKERKKAGISIYSFENNSLSKSKICGKILAGIIGLPYFIFSAVTSLPMIAAESYVRGKVKDKAFCNTVSFGIKLGMTIVLFPIYAVLAFIFMPWWLALATLVLWLPTYGYYHDYVEGCRRLFSDIRLLRNKKIMSSFRKIINSFKS